MHSEGGVADSNSKTFYVMNKFMFFFGIGYTIYSIIIAIIQKAGIVLSIFSILFCVLLLISSGCGHKLKNSSCGLKTYIAFTLIIFVWIVILIIVALVTGAIGGIWSIIQLICWGLLGLATLIALIIAFRMNSSSGGSKYTQIV